MTEILEKPTLLNRAEVLRQIKYALEYVRTGDLVEASVNAGYYSSKENARNSKHYARPFNYEICQEVLHLIGENGEKVPSLVLDRYKDKVEKVNINPPSKFIKSYRDNKEKYGYKYKEFLYDIMDNNRIYPKDRLTALELLVKIESGYFDKFNKNSSKKVMVIKDDI